MKQFFTRTFSSLRNLFRKAEIPAGTKCIIGLGNPGEEYRLSRHNVGFRVIEELVRSQHAKLERANNDFLLARCSDGTNIFLAVQPLTFMNRSGIVVRGMMDRYRLLPENILILFDDFQLPLGTLRIRSDGGDGGHNGVGSIIRESGTNKFPRMRVGIACASCPKQNKKELMAKYVLSPFDSEEEDMSEKMIAHARDAALDWVRHGNSHAMSRFNRSFADSVKRNNIAKRR